MPSICLGTAIAFMPRRQRLWPGIKTQGLKVIFDFLKSHRLDAMSIQPIANSRTTKTSLLCQLAAIFTGIFGQNVVGRGCICVLRFWKTALTRGGSQICHPPSPIAYVRIINNFLREMMLFTSKIVHRYSQLIKIDLRNQSISVYRLTTPVMYTFNRLYVV